MNYILDLLIKIFKEDNNKKNNRDKPWEPEPIYIDLEIPESDEDDEDDDDAGKRVIIIDL